MANFKELGVSLSPAGQIEAVTSDLSWRDLEPLDETEYKRNKFGSYDEKGEFDNGGRLEVPSPGGQGLLTGTAVEIFDVNTFVGKQSKGSQYTSTSLHYTYPTANERGSVTQHRSGEQTRVTKQVVLAAMDNGEVNAYDGRVVAPEGTAELQAYALEEGRLTAEALLGAIHGSQQQAS